MIWHLYLTRQFTTEQFDGIEFFFLPFFGIHRMRTNQFNTEQFTIFFGWGFWNFQLICQSKEDHEDWLRSETFIRIL